MSGVSDRIKKLRNDSGLSQKVFAERMGLSRDVISNIEYERTELKEYVAKAICREFKINYLWLVDGLGDPQNGIPDSIFDEIRSEYDLSDDDIEIIKEYASMNSSQRKSLRDYLKGMIEIKKREG